jgi:hypothetical protein
VNFDSAVAVGANGLPSLILSDGATAAYAGGSGSAALRFDYTVAAGQNSADVAVSAIKLNGSTIQDSGGAAATLTGAVTNPAGTLQIDTTLPGVVYFQINSSTLQADGTAVVTYLVSFTESVTGVSASSFSVATTKDVTGSVVSVTNQFNSGYYLVQIDLAGLDSGGTAQLKINNAQIMDPAGNLMSGYGFTPQGPAQPIAEADNTSHVEVADVNGDGIGDIIAPNESANDVAVFLGSRTGTFTPAPGAPFAAPSPTFAAVQDVNADGIPDILVSNGQEDEVSVLLGQGGGSFGTPKSILVGPATSEAGALQIADVNGDGIPDLVVANTQAGTVSVMVGKGAGDFIQAPGSPIPVGVDPQSVAIGDVNRDGFLDLAVADAGSNDVTVLLGQGDGSFTPATGSAIPVGTAPSSVAIREVSGDNLLDLVVANAGDNSVSVLFGDGKGSFHAAPRSPVPVGNDPQAAVVADINDFGGQPDIVIANTRSNTVSVLSGNGGGD